MGQTKLHAQARYISFDVRKNLLLDYWNQYSTLPRFYHIFALLVRVCHLRPVFYSKKGSDNNKKIDSSAFFFLTRFTMSVKSTSFL